MILIQSTHDGDLDVTEDTAIYAQVTGSVTVRDKQHLHLYGQVFGQVFVQPGGQAVIFGQALGGLHNAGRTVVHGMVLKDYKATPDAELEVASGAVMP